MRVGQKVVCLGQFIDNSKYKSIKFPIKGEIYTVRELNEFKGRAGIKLEEVVNAKYMFSRGVEEPFFLATYFRPVDYSFGEQVAEQLASELSQITQTEQV